MKILFVCSGNICRSAMAEAALRAELRAAGVDGVDIASAGTLGIEGSPADVFAARVAGESGCDLSAHRSRGLSGEEMRLADLVAVMESQHLDEARRLAPSHGGVRLLTEFLPEGDPARGSEIDDPIGGTLEEFRECLALIRRCLAGMRAELTPRRDPGEPRDAKAPEAEYFERAADRIAAARGGAAELTSMEFHVVDRWWQSGVPLWLALESLEAAAGLWMPGEAPRSFLEAVEAEMARRREAMPPEMPASCASPSKEDPIARACALLRARIESSLRELTADLEPLRRALLDAGRKIDPAPESIAGLETALAGIRRAIADAAEACATDADRLAARDEALGALRARGGPAAAAPPADLVRRLTESRLLARFPVPSFSLLDLLDRAD
ncbi:MAG: hypothetical protein HY049_19385 [Acidobacteria bacterium]|nr:hypothetical protein [Acidobacteriota bacterium]